MRYLPVLLALTLILFGCTAVTESTTAPLPTLAVTAPPVLSTVPPPTLPATNTAVSPLTTPTAAETAVSSSGTAEIGQPVTPVTVDLGQLTPAPQPNTTPVEMPRPGVPNPLIALVHATKQDLAKRLGLDISQVVEGTIAEITWNDSSLGCPQPGMGYLDVLTNGYKITLNANGQDYTYHTDANQRFVLCGADGKPLP